jgi:hypothetical protein
VLVVLVVARGTGRAGRCSWLLVVLSVVVLVVVVRGCARGRGRGDNPGGGCRGADGSCGRLCW